MADDRATWTFDPIWTTARGRTFLERVDVYHKNDQESPAFSVLGAEWRDLRAAFVEIERHDFPTKPEG